MNMFKRFFDICFSLTVLFFGAPIFLLIALIIRISSPGPIFFAGLRYGKDHKVFKCWKFRSMVPGAEMKLQEVLDSNPSFREEWMTYRKIKEDPRTYPFGRFLRKYSLDELPQFWNALIGDMSIVGPRAYILSEVDEELGIRAEKILSCKPGITGIWQTSGRNLLTFNQRIGCDEQYVERLSIAFDLKLVAKTILLLIRPKGAF